MANFNTTTKIIKGAVTGSEISSVELTPTGVSQQVNEYLETIDDAKLVSVTCAHDGAHMLTVVIITKD